MQLITINTTNSDYSNTIGQRVGLSYMDIKKANYVYCKSIHRYAFDNSLFIID